jgi:signal transduction histidine kinase
MEAEKFQALGRLARGITHDFNNLLTAVSTSAELLELENELNESSRENVEAILHASGRARDLSKQLMLFGNPESGATASTRLAELAHKWESLLQKLVPRSVSFEFEPAPDIAVTIGESALIQVITNLVMNAADAAPDGTVKLTWKVEAGHVVMLVTDDGIGMSDDVKKRLFEPYFTTKGPKGTGLGLPTVYGLVQNAGGSVVADSVEGVGTTFEVRLPIA